MAEPRAWTEVISGLPAVPAPGRGRLELVVAGARHPDLSVAFAPWGAFRVADPSTGQLVVGTLAGPGAGPADLPERPDRPAYGALEFVHDLLRPAGLGTVVDLAGAVAVAAGRALDVGLPGGPPRLRLILDAATALLTCGQFLPDTDRLSWELTGWTPCLDPDPALFTVPGSAALPGADWVLAPGEPG